MEGCRTCNEGNDLECTSCLTSYSLYFNTLAGSNKCRQTFCKEGNFTAAQTCTECLEGYVLNGDGTCTETCKEPNPAVDGFIEDYFNKVCRVKCASNQYNHPNNVNLCVDCSTLQTPGLGLCNKCAYTDNIVGRLPVVCLDCINAMTPNATGVCKVQNCKTINTATPSKCDECNNGFFRAWDTTECYPLNVQQASLSCPAGYITYISPNVCGPICAANQFVDP